MGDENREDTMEDDCCFIPSPLALSVRPSRGGSNNEIEQELNSISKQAWKAEENRFEK